jgi:hypothetical protein
MTMNQEEYAKKLDIVILEDLKRIKGSKHPGIHTGRSGKILYELALFQASPTPFKLMTIKEDLNYAFKNIYGVMKDCSFFHGPLGVIWASILVQELTNKVFIKKNLIDKVLDDYFQEQKNLLKDKNGVLDYLYGVSGWFIIYPYLNEKYQKNIISLFEYQLDRFNGETIYKQSLEANSLQYIEQKDLLGFAHGHSSLCFIYDDYPINKRFNKKIELLKNKIRSSFNKKYELSRHYQGTDFIRQEWCHGALGSIYFQDDELKKNVLTSYLNSIPNSNCHGLCHGAGQHIILSKIAEDLFNVRLSVTKPVLEDMNITPARQSEYLLQSHLISKMSLIFDPVRDNSFTWWRMCYPVNRKTLV